MIFTSTLTLSYPCVLWMIKALFVERNREKMCRCGKFTNSSKIFLHIQIMKGVKLKSFRFRNTHLDIVLNLCKKLSKKTYISDNARMVHPTAISHNNNNETNETIHISITFEMQFQHKQQQKTKKKSFFILCHTSIFDHIPTAMKMKYPCLINISARKHNVQHATNYPDYYLNLIKACRSAILQN